MSLVDPSMQDLPEPLIVDILSRLPVKTIIHCKCVCKKWLNIVLDSNFADLQLSRSPACFMIEELIDHKKSRILKWVEVQDELNHHNLHHDPVMMSLDLNLATVLQDSGIHPVGAVDGLLCLQQFGQGTDNAYICNPVTREYMILPTRQHSREVSTNFVYCFGVGSLTRQYKLIRIFENCIKADSTLTLPGSEAEVYTLGTGQWRSLGHVSYRFNVWNGTFLEGHTHWILDYLNHRCALCAFDFDKEVFELFPNPPYEEAIEESLGAQLVVLKGCLCRCDSYESNFTVWVMKEYGIEKSWHKELVIKYGIIPDAGTWYMNPWFEWYLIQGYEDGTILMRSHRGKLIIYCPRRNRIVETGIFAHNYTPILAYSPSFHRLHNFENERVLHVF